MSYLESQNTRTIDFGTNMGVNHDIILDKYVYYDLERNTEMIRLFRYGCSILCVNLGIKSHQQPPV
jgi:hypothetical protein